MIIEYNVTDDVIGEKKSATIQESNRGNDKNTCQQSDIDVV